MIPELLSADIMSRPAWMWLIFAAIILAILILDLGVLHRRSHEVGFRESLMLSGFYVSLGLLFGGWVWWEMGPEKGAEYLTGYVLEETLSMDNIFVMAVIFSYMGIPRIYQHRVLFWGILGVVIMRGIMIGLGVALIHKFAWILYIFAVFLVVTGLRMLMGGQEEAPDFSNNPILKFMSRRFRVTDRLYEQKFFVRVPYRGEGPPVWHITPLLVTLVLIEFTDVLFAVDSVPAIFAVTTDPYIVYTSNIFAILGLRAMYFVLSAMIARFEYLKYALSLVLVFIGAKVLIGDLTPVGKIPPMISLTVTLGILSGGLLASVWRARKDARTAAAEKSG